MTDQFLIESRELFADGGPFLWWLIALAFGIAISLISIWRTLDQISLPAAGFDGPPEEMERLFFDSPARRIPFAFVLISAAPLIGLLGTVSGMLVTFSGMASGDGEASPADIISHGISEALITTEAGLVIAVPSYIVCSLLKHRFDRLRLEFERSVCAIVERS